jgi:hypothetical protein
MRRMPIEDQQDTTLETGASEDIEATGGKYGNLLTRIGHCDFRSCG